MKHGAENNAAQLHSRLLTKKPGFWELRKHVQDNSFLLNLKRRQVIAFLHDKLRFYLHFHMSPRRAKHVLSMLDKHYSVNWNSFATESSQTYFKIFFLFLFLYEAFSLIIKPLQKSFISFRNIVKDTIHFSHSFNNFPLIIFCCIQLAGYTVLGTRLSLSMGQRSELTLHSAQ